MLSAGAVLGLFPPSKHLRSNPPGNPQDFVTDYPLAAGNLCINRSKDFCAVYIDVPQQCAGKNSCPIVFCLHGFGGFATEYFEVCSPSVHEHGFIGVYPQGDPLGYLILPDNSTGVLSGWNDGQSVFPKDTLLKCKYDDFTCNLDPNEGIFFPNIAAAFPKLGAHGRFFSFGQSNGADISQRLAVNADGKLLSIAGIATQSCQLLANPPRSAAGPFNYNQPQSDRPPVAQLSIHGDDDTSIPFEGGSRFNSDVFELMPERDSDMAWAQHNGCNGPITSTNVTSNFTKGPPRHHTGSVQFDSVGRAYIASNDPPQNFTTGVATHYVFGGCPDIAPVELYQDRGAGHVGTKRLSGKPVFEVVLEFFERVEKAHLARAAA